MPSALSFHRNAHDKNNQWSSVSPKIGALLPLLFLLALAVGVVVGLINRLHPYKALMLIAEVAEVDQFDQ